MDNLSARTWQLVQTGLLNVEQRYVATETNFVPNKSYAMEVIRRRLRPDLKVTFVALAETPLPPAGKFIVCKSELAESRLGKLPA